MRVPSGFLKHLHSERHREAVKKQNYTEIDALISEMQTVKIDKPVTKPSHTRKACKLSDSREKLKAIFKSQKEGDGLELDTQPSTTIASQVFHSTGE